MATFDGVLPVPERLTPMLSRLEDSLPSGEGWLYEPKWDGFRALVYRDGERIRLLSRNGQPLERYFPELLLSLGKALPERCVVDGEIVLETPAGLDFDALLQRIHPAASRIALLAGQTPTSFVAFDLLCEGDEDLRAHPFAERRRRLERLLGGKRGAVFLTPQTGRLAVARRWFDEFERRGLDGIVAKRREQPYEPGERVMVKVKHVRTADCVVGGYRRASRGEGVGSLLLGLYDADGVLHYVGHTSSFSAKERREVLERLKPLEGRPSFGEGRAPGGPSRWSRGRETEWTSVAPQFVCEVAYDKIQGDRFRHAVRFLRWRPDKAPRDCLWEREVGGLAPSPRALTQ